MGVNNKIELIQSKINQINLMIVELNVPIQESIMLVNDEKPPMQITFEEVLALREQSKQDLILQKEVYMQELAILEANTSIDV